VRPQTGVSAGSPIQDRPLVLLLDLDGVLRRWDPTLVSSAEEQAGLPSGALTAKGFSSQNPSNKQGAGASDVARWRRDDARWRLGGSRLLVV
jgi:putative hydrolase of the HAD superfamily